MGELAELMGDRAEEPLVPTGVEQAIKDEIAVFVSRPEWEAFVAAYRSLNEAAHDGVLPFDPRFNAVHWAFDVSELCQQTRFAPSMVSSLIDGSSGIECGTSPRCRST